MTIFFNAVKVSTCRLDAIIKNSLLALIFSSFFNITNCYADVSVGDSYGGGTVFCVSQTPDITKCVTQGSGKYGLIMANKDQVNFDSNSEHGVTWANEYKETKAISDDDGAANTAAIITAHFEDNPSNNAAWLCRNYKGGGYEDWYLPSKNELNKMYLYAEANNLIGRDCVGRKPGGVKCFIGGYKGDWKAYWSSTEDPSGYFAAWDQDFSSGVQYDSSKIGHCFGVRAVRAFNYLTLQQVNYLPKPKSSQGVESAVPAVSPQIEVPAAATPFVVAPAAAAPQAPTAAAAAPAVAPSAPAHIGTDRFTFGAAGDRLARLGDLTQLYPPSYQPPVLIQAMAEAGVPAPGEVNAFCDDVVACAVANGSVNCTKLTKEDAATIAAYTFDFGDANSDKNPYRMINGGLFERNALQLRKLRGLIYRLLHALRSVQPVQPHTLFRGIRERVKLNDTHYHRGNKITWHTFSSTTRDMEATKLFLTDQNTGKCEGTLFIIRGTLWGYNIQPFSCFPEEEEILLEPEIELRVASVLDPPVGLTIVDLEMLPDQKLLLERLIPRNVGGVVGLGSSPALAFVAPVQDKRYTAQADWQSTIAGGLSFKRWDVLTIIGDSGGWWMGELNGQRGWVPPSYLKPNFPAPAPQAF